MILVEGVFDAVKAGDNTIPLLGSSINENQYLFQEIAKNANQIYLALDSDANQKQIKIASLLSKYDLNIKLINLLPFKDPGSMTTEQFFEKKDQAETFTSDDLITKLFE